MSWDSASSSTRGRTALRTAMRCRRLSSSRCPAPSVETPANSCARRWVKPSGPPTWATCTTAAQRLDTSSYPHCSEGQSRWIPSVRAGRIQKPARFLGIKSAQDRGLAHYRPDWRAVRQGSGCKVLQKARTSTRTSEEGPRPGGRARCKSSSLQTAECKVECVNIACLTSHHPAR